MGEHHANFLAPAGVEDGRNFFVPPDDGLALVDVKKAGALLVRRPAGALLCSCKNERNEEAAEEFSALIAEPLFAVINQDNFSGVHLFADVELGLRRAEHLFDN